jgi:diguanylate cyclase
MGWQLKTRRDQYRFTAVIAGIVLLLTCLLHAIFLPLDLSTGSIWPGAATGVLIAVPITWVIGQRLRDMQTRSAQLEHALDYDLLTGVHTRASFYKRVDASGDRPCAVIVVDIDHFKAFNDRHGHFAGDQALRQFAAILSGNCRHGDLVARFGGEEFVVMLRGADLETGRVVAERLALRVRQSPIFFGEQCLHLTASFGVAAVGPGGDMDTALRNADKALYQAKHAGRDRAHSHISDPVRPRRNAAQ